MTLNKTAIEWCDRTWNPVTGCQHGCPYCYARKIAERFHGPAGFIPAFHPERLEDPIKQKKPQTIFVCSMADLFGNWVPDLWIEMVFAEIQNAKQHTYIFLTKNPSRYLRIPLTYFSKNVWVGATVTGINDIDRIYELRKLPNYVNKFISFEPLLGIMPHIDLIGSPFFDDEPEIKQVIIGAQTNPSVEVTPEMVQPIGEATCPGVVPVVKMFCKDSMPMWAKARRELCWELHK